jgi:NAD(P)H-dependent nitrite reductase small subunit
MMLTEGWTRVCDLEDVLHNTGVCALIDGRQIAVFRLGAAVFALDNLDPASQVNVLSRGLLGDIKGERVVASPLYKHHYGLTTGRCLEDPSKCVSVYPVRVLDARIWVNTQVTGIELYSPAELATSAATGEPSEETAGAELLVLRDPRRGVYKRLTIRGNRLHGAVLYGDAQHGQWYFELMAAGQDITPLRDQLLFGPTLAAELASVTAAG